MNWRMLIFLIIVGLVVFKFNQKNLIFNPVAKSSVKTSVMDSIQESLQNKSPLLKGQKKQDAAEALPILNWLSKAAVEMDTDSYDVILEEAKLKDKAAWLSAEDVLVLKEVVLSDQSSANERILSTYLLSLSSSQGLKTLQEIATSELSIKETPEAHSLDETQSMHEKTLRRMAIDELFRRAIADSSYRDQLSREIERISVPELKAYAQNRFKQLFK